MMKPLPRPMRVLVALVGAAIATAELNKSVRELTTVDDKAGVGHLSARTEKQIEVGAHAFQVALWVFSAGYQAKK